MVVKKHKDPETPLLTVTESICCFTLSYGFQHLAVGLATTLQRIV